MRQTTIAITLSALIVSAAFATTKQNNREDSVSNSIELMNLPAEVAKVADRKPCNIKQDLQSTATIGGQILSDLFHLTGYVSLFVMLFVSTVIGCNESVGSGGRLTR